jgi:hypothetical protein
MIDDLHCLLLLAQGRRPPPDFLSVRGTEPGDQADPAILDGVCSACGIGCSTEFSVPSWGKDTTVAISVAGLEKKFAVKI